MSDNISIKMALLSLYGLIQAVQKQQRALNRREIKQEMSREEDMETAAKPVEPVLTSEELEAKPAEAELVQTVKTESLSAADPDQLVEESELSPTVEPEKLESPVATQPEPLEELNFWTDDWKQPALVRDERL
ncbi:MAG: hypothetical protein MJ157_01190, partial [Clostridia bacterium]|nr:hypothetical protein [Clostridia bacterium]